MMIPIIVLAALALVAYTGFMVGSVIGRGMAETEVINYCRKHSMNTTDELLRDMYPLRKDLNPTIDRQKKQEYVRA